MDCHKNNTKYILGITLLYLISSNVFGQPALWSELKQRYPDESAVFLSRDKTITLEVRNDSVVATATMEERILFLKDRPDNATDMRIFGSHFMEIENVKAITSVWDKTKYKDIPLSGLTRQREDDASVFYDDSYFYHLSFPASHAGNQAYWSYQEKYRDARFLPTYFFQDYLRQINGKLLIRVPKNVEITSYILNDSDDKIKFRQYEKGNYVNYEWTVSDMPSVKREEKSPKYSYFVPLVVFYVKSIKDKNETKTILSNLSDLNSWYYETIRSIEEEQSNESLIELANSLITPDDMEIDKVRKVFYWVQDNIRYIAFEDGMRGLVPHKPAYVLEKRYGDCKDMASLIIGLLKALGIKSYYTWIGTRDIPYQYSQLPSPLVDNHMIATYIDKNNRYYFLDGTSNYTSIELPSSMIQGKEAFIAINKNEYQVKVVPEIVAQRNQQRDSVYLRIDNGTLYGKGKAHYLGYQKVFASYDFNKTVATRQKDNVSFWLKKGSNKFILDHYQISNMEDKDNPLSISYDFRINDYITFLESEMYVNLNLVKVYYNQFIKPERKIPMEIDYRFSAEDVYFLDVPLNYEIEYLPPDTQFENDLLKFKTTYKLEKSRIRVNQSFESNILLLTPNRFELWNAAIKELSNSYKESIIFKKKSS